jgi:hypothetical protein
MILLKTYEAERIKGALERAARGYPIDSDAARRFLDLIPRINEVTEENPFPFEEMVSLFGYRGI